MICPHCAFPNEPGTAVCIKCKRSLSEPAADAEPSAGPDLEAAPAAAGSAGAGAADADVAAAERELERAQQLERSGRLREAFLACQSVMLDARSELPRALEAEIHLVMGRISSAQDKPERAERYLDRAAALVPGLNGLEAARRLSGSGTAPAPAPGAQAEAEPEPEPESVREAESEPEPDAAAVEEAEPESEPEPEPEPEPAAAGEVASEPARAEPPAVARPSVQGRLCWAAGFWARVLALAIDGLLLLGLTAAAVALGALLLDLDGQALLTTLAGSLGSLVTVGLTFIGLLLIYTTGFARFGGQTVGKMVLGLRVVRRDGHSLTTWNALCRALGMLLAGLPGLAGFLWAAFDLQRRGWHDRLAGTLVVRIRPPRALRQADAGAAAEPEATAEPASGAGPVELAASSGGS